MTKIRKVNDEGKKIKLLLVFFLRISQIIL